MLLKDVFFVEDSKYGMVVKYVIDVLKYYVLKNGVKIGKMVNMDIIKFVVKEVFKEDIIEARDRKGNWLHLNWCRLQYYDKFEGCPKNCDNSFIYDELIGSPYIIVGAKCDYKKYLDEMRTKFDDWSERKLRIPYLWQHRINRLLIEKTNEVILEYENRNIFDLTYLDVPEKHGVFVIATMLRLGYEIELKPINIVWKINLLGKQLTGNVQKKVTEYFR